MIPYLDCRAAQELLEAFIDGELAVADQVALESHLRWCTVCAARVEDVQLIGVSLRVTSCARQRHAARHRHAKFSTRVVAHGTPPFIRPKQAAAPRPRKNCFPPALCPRRSKIEDRPYRYRGLFPLSRRFCLDESAFSHSLSR